jgi:hypothetical protein
MRSETERKAVASDTQLVALHETLYTSSKATRLWLSFTRCNWIFESLRRSVVPVHARALEVEPASCVYLSALTQLFSKVFVTDIDVAYSKHAVPSRQSHRNLRLITISRHFAAQLPTVKLFRDFSF